MYRIMLICTVLYIAQAHWAFYVLGIALAMIKNVADNAYHSED